MCVKSVMVGPSHFSVNMTDLSPSDYDYDTVETVEYFMAFWT